MVGMKRFDKDNVPDRAMRVFWERGYESTSIDDLLKATGINRGSLYGTFSDRRSLFLSAQDPYVPHLSLRPLVFVFPVGIEKSDYVLVNLDTYPWRNLPGVTLTRDGSSVTIGADGIERRYAVAAQGGPHLLLRRLSGRASVVNAPFRRLPPAVLLPARPGRERSRRPQHPCRSSLPPVPAA